jgi:Phytanoyl-CoA dioxygenase (PhyH)
VWGDIVDRHLSNSGDSALNPSDWSKAMLKSLKSKFAVVRFQGCVDEVANGKVKGWCIEPGALATPVFVDAMADGTVVASTCADISRPDLLAAGLGTSVGGFELPLPPIAVDGEILIVPRGSDVPLARIPPTAASALQPAPLTGPLARQIERLRKSSPFFNYIPSDIAPDRVRAEMFPQIGPMAWLDREDHDRLISAAEDSGYLTEYGAQLCRRFARDGYCVIERAVSHEDCDRAWHAFDAWARSHPEIVGEVPDKVLPDFGRQVNIHRYVPEMRELLHHPVITEAIDLLFGFKCIPFQTIPSYFGSQQLAHSDAIHMATFPLGLLAASWIALEDITADCGPLFYHPQSHRLPYLFSDELGISADVARTGYQVYRDIYEPAIAARVKKNAFDAPHFVAKKGDALIWHHNLIHGGSAVTNPNSSRKSLVCHYYADTALCYHDLTAYISDVDAELGAVPAGDVLAGLAARSHAPRLRGPSAQD